MRNIYLVRHGESEGNLNVEIYTDIPDHAIALSPRGVRDIVVVCHGVTMRAFVMQWLHLPYEWFESQPNPGNCDIYHLTGKSSSNGGGFVYRGASVL